MTIDILRKLLLAFLKNRTSRFEEGRLGKEQFREILKENLQQNGVKVYFTKHLNMP